MPVRIVHYLDYIIMIMPLQRFLMTYILLLHLIRLSGNWKWGKKVEAWLAGLNAEDDARTQFVGIDVSTGK